MTTKKKGVSIDWRVLCTAIVGVTALELGAMYNGMNGVALTVAIGAICVIAGVAIPTGMVKIKN